MEDYDYGNAVILLAHHACMQSESNVNYYGAFENNTDTGIGNGGGARVGQFGSGHPGCWCGGRAYVAV